MSFFVLIVVLICNQHEHVITKARLRAIIASIRRARSGFGAVAMRRILKVIIRSLLHLERLKASAI